MIESCSERAGIARLAILGVIAAIVVAGPVALPASAAGSTPPETATATATPTADESDPVPPAGVPDAPQASAEAQDRSASVSWSEPRDGGSPLTGFTVRVSPGDTTVEVGPETRAVVVPGLVNGTSYTFTVSASNATGAGSPSEPAGPVVPFGPPKPPLDGRLSTADATVIAAWTAPAPNGRPIVGYQVDLASSAGPRTVSVDSTARQAVVDGLTNGLPYSVTVSTIDDAGGKAGVSVGTATPGRPPGPPGTPQAAPGTAATTKGPSAVVSWAAATANGTPVTGYVITTSPGGQTTTVGAGTTRATVAGLTTGRAYTFTVAATSSSGPGPASPPSPPLTLTPIDVHFASLGGPASYLGAPSGAEYAVGAGRARNYAGGRIYWTQATGAHAVRGAILTRYVQLGGPTGFVGFPTSDETAAGPGRRSTFTGASLYWGSSTGAREVHGAILVAYEAMGGASSVLGLPKTDESITADRVGRYNHFAGGSIYWSPATGAREVHGAIHSRWSADGWESGMLGYPTSNEYAVAGGRRSDFQYGSVTWTAATGARSTITRGDQIVKRTRTHLGKRYVYGATGPNTFDCSGLVQYVHGSLGMKVPRTTYQQRSAARPISRAAAQPGDVIFLLNGSHDGIYVGGGQMIDAPKAGDVVRQRAIWTSDYTVGRFW